jgi:hypothetical protein
MPIFYVYITPLLLLLLLVWSCSEPCKKVACVLLNLSLNYSQTIETNKVLMLGVRTRCIMLLRILYILCDNIPACLAQIG